MSFEEMMADDPARLRYRMRLFEISLCQVKNGHWNLGVATDALDQLTYQCRCIDRAWARWPL